MRCGILLAAWLTGVGARGEGPPEASPGPGGWREAERGVLENHVQLTFPDRFEKAGEAYFSPDGKRIIFQAIEAPAEGATAEEFYAMFVADLERGADGRVRGLAAIRRISPAGSANTCGWFDAADPAAVLFATTMVPPTESHPPGYERSSGRYRWMFPPEMRIVRGRLGDDEAAPPELETLAGGAGAYVAEGALSPDGRHLVYCSLESGQGDIYVKDLQRGRTVRITTADGYDGGPFFAPDGQRLCYRSDRLGDNLLQLYVADLALGEDGGVRGREREYQLTDNEHVNWCPYWHPGGRHLIYSTSEIGHQNYELFLIDADPGDLPASPGPIRYGSARRRVTHAEGSDVLPAFSGDGKSVMWASRRGADGSVQLWIADFVMDLGPRTPGGAGREGARRGHESRSDH
jgi:hypothetical protein